MAQWDNLGHAATIAQLAGVDALGLISTILQTAQAIRHNRETCLELGQDLQRVESLLNLLRESETMKKDEIKNVLNGLDRTLKEADSLVKSCRDCSLAYRIFMGWKQSDQFRRVKKKINKHLRFYDMISHAVIIRRMEEFAKSAQSSSSSQQDAQEVRTSSTNSQNPEARNPVGGPVEIVPVEIEMTQKGTTVQEHQQAERKLPQPLYMPSKIMRCLHVALVCIGYDEEAKDPPPSMWDVLLMLSCESAFIPEVPRRRRGGPQSTQHPEASGSGWAHFNDAGELSDSDVVEPR